MVTGAEAKIREQHNKSIQRCMLAVAGAWEDGGVGQCAAGVEALGGG